MKKLEEFRDSVIYGAAIGFAAALLGSFVMGGIILLLDLITHIFGVNLLPNLSLNRLQAHFVILALEIISLLFFKYRGGLIEKEKNIKSMIGLIIGIILSFGIIFLL